MKSLARIFDVVLAALLAFAPTAALAQNPSPTPPPSQNARRAADMVKNMTAAQKVGQLFLISFPNNDVSLTSDIADLILNYNIGGVRLKAANQNFANGVDGTRQITKLTADLQTLAGISITALITGGPGAAPAGAFTPLFIAVNQEGNSPFNSEITQGVTDVPGELALGATWKPQYAETVGSILGADLAALGINVLTGPVLDVLDSPKPNAVSDPGARAFGGDPFWVGQFGQSFIGGVHSGSSNRIAVIAKNFPGLGSSDRNVEEEIPTVQKSLEQLKLLELAPFFAVTQLNTQTAADGLLVSHIRYRGFQGNIRASTRPVSLDPQAYADLMALPEIAPWRNAGGVTFSDALGVRSVRRFYDPLEQSFNARQIARDAFLAGNDVLDLGAFALNTNSWQEQFVNIKDTILFFRERYQSEPAFASKVDAAVTRIIGLKLKLYGGSFDAANILNRKPTAVPPTPQSATSPTGTPSPAATGDKLAAIARDSITLLSPTIRDLAATIPSAPSKDDGIVFITDDRVLRDCARCAAYPAISKTALQDIVVRLYGPRATGQVNPARLSSFSFADLAEYGAKSSAAITATPTAKPITPALDVTPANAITATEPASATLRIQTAIDNARWVIIGLIDLDPAQKGTAIFRNFLAQRADALRDKRVIVYALGAPYQLDLTEISKMTAYVGVFSSSAPSLEAAMKSLFGEFGYAGASPVSIPALNYALTEQTAPDPARDIPLLASDTLTRTISGTPTSGTATPLNLKVGDRLKLRAGPILDRNGRIVPDNTPVQFSFSYPSERVEQTPALALTKDGYAETTTTIDRKGSLFIRASADRATRSYIVRVDIGDTTASIETLRPTPLPTTTIEPTISPTLVRPTNTTVNTPTPTPETPPRPLRANLVGFLLTLIGLSAMGSGLVLFLRARGMALAADKILRMVILAWTGGWLTYVLCALGVFGSAPLGANPAWLGGWLMALLISAAILAGGAYYLTKEAKKRG
ncbi:MAG TPA: glycoside hydrolase family 3 N-terminal domain-containing protein, partial [Thermoflexales bacterium]|nr:glycoside hydrolase family 3 N-terminal domain-containing protein [Thermoflexales bacterium]